MRELLHVQNIIIRSAEKGSGIVVIETNKYMYVDQLENESK